jgi:hypothetical protein
MGGTTFWEEFDERIWLCGSFPECKYEMPFAEQALLPTCSLCNRPMVRARKLTRIERREDDGSPLVGSTGWSIDDETVAEIRRAVLGD